MIYMVPVICDYCNTMLGEVPAESRPVGEVRCMDCANKEKRTYRNDMSDALYDWLENEMYGYHLIYHFQSAHIDEQVRQKRLETIARWKTKLEQDFLLA